MSDGCVRREFTAHDVPGTAVGEATGKREDEEVVMAVAVIKSKADGERMCVFVC